MKVRGHVTAVAPRSEPDGSHRIEVTTFEGEAVEALIPKSHAAYMLRVIQEAAIRRAAGAPDATLRRLRVTGIQLGEAEADAELMVSTAEIASVMLLLTQEQLSFLRSEIDRFLDRQTQATAAERSPIGETSPESQAPATYTERRRVRAPA